MEAWEVFLQEWAANPAGVGVRGWVPVEAGCNEVEKSGSGVGERAISGGGDAHSVF